MADGLPRVGLLRLQRHIRLCSGTMQVHFKLSRTLPRFELLICNFAQGVGGLVLPQRYICALSPCCFLAWAMFPSLGHALLAWDSVSDGQVEFEGEAERSTSESDSGRAIRRLTKGKGKGEGKGKGKDTDNDDPPGYNPTQGEGKGKFSNLDFCSHVDFVNFVWAKGKDKGKDNDLDEHQAPLGDTTYQPFDSSFPASSAKGQSKSRCRSRSRSRSSRRDHNPVAVKQKNTHRIKTTILSRNPGAGQQTQTVWEKNEPAYGPLRDKAYRLTTRLMTEQWERAHDEISGMMRRALNIMWDDDVNAREGYVRLTGNWCIQTGPFVMDQSLHSPSQDDRELIAQNYMTMELVSSLTIPKPKNMPKPKAKPKPGPKAQAAAAKARARVERDSSD